MDIKALTSPVGIVRIFEVILNCITFGLVVSIGTTNIALWVWPVFTWCFCFSITFVILVLEFTQLNAKLPISWEDFTTAYAMMATLMMLSSSIIYPKLFATVFNKAIGATVTSILAFILYAVEVVLTRAKHGSKRSSCRAMVLVELQAITQPVGMLRVMAAILTCICFSLVASLGGVSDSYWAWCMFTWCYCFFFTFLIVILEFTTVNTKLPFAWEDFTAAHAMLASLMIFSVSIIYPSVFASSTCAISANCQRLIGASIVSWVCFLVYTAEVSSLQDFGGAWLCTAFASSSPSS
ncbi:uncharacterized protein V6R79_012767 [Siganus canaliculatus]